MERERPDQSELGESEQTVGRDYLRARNEVEKLRRLEGIKFVSLEVGDYIEMPVSQFKSWRSATPEQAAPSDQESGNVRVTVRTVNENSTLVVEGGGITKTINASLFTNFGKQHPH